MISKISIRSRGRYLSTGPWQVSVGMILMDLIKGEGCNLLVPKWLHICWSLKKRSFKIQEGKRVIISYMPSKVQGYNRELFTNSWFKSWKKGLADTIDWEFKLLPKPSMVICCFGCGSPRMEICTGLMWDGEITKARVSKSWTILREIIKAHVSESWTILC